MPLQTINLGDHINAAIDKINENFELLEWATDSNSITNVINNYLDSSITNYFDFTEVIDSDYIQSIITNLSIEGNIDSAQVFSIIAEMGLQARLDSVEGGFILLAQDYTNLSTSYTNLADSVSALSTAQSSLTSQISVINGQYEVLSQDLVDLEAQFTGSIDIDSDLIVQAVGGALSSLETRISANSDEISVVSQSVTDLSADISILDSNLNEQLNVNATAISNLVASASLNSDGIEALSGRFDSFQVTLDQAIQEGLTITPEQVASAIGGITDDIYTRLNANSESISVVAGDIQTLNTALELVNSDGYVTSIVSNAGYALTSEVEAKDSDNFSAVSQLLIDLENKVDSDFQAAEIKANNTYTTQDDVTSAIQEAGFATTQDVGDAVQDAKLEISNDYVAQGDLFTAVQEGGFALTTEVNSNIAQAESRLNTRIDEQGNVSVGYTLNLNANGHVAGIEFNNDGATADMTIVADKFGIVNASNNAVKPFTVSGDNILLSNATVTGQLNISSTGNGGSMTMTNDVMTIFDNAGNTRVVFGRLE